MFFDNMLRQRLFYQPNDPDSDQQIISLSGCTASVPHKTGQFHLQKSINIVTGNTDNRCREGCLFLVNSRQEPAKLVLPFMKLPVSLKGAIYGLAD